MTQQLQVPAARVKTGFPLAVPVWGFTRDGGKVNISQPAPLHKLCGRGPQCDRQGKNFTKPFNLTLAVVFLASKLCLLCHVEKLRISEKVGLPRETPPETLPLSI